MSTTDTPKTDAAIFRREHRGLNNMWTTEEVSADFARTLERQNRELAEALNGVLRRFQREYTALTDGEFGTIEDFYDVEKARAALTKAHAADFLDEFCAQDDEQKGTETRWPNVQAALDNLGYWFKTSKSAGEMRAIVQNFEGWSYFGEWSPTLEQALDSLEQKLAERKEGR